MSVGASLPEETRRELNREEMERRSCRSADADSSAEEAMAPPRRSSQVRSGHGGRCLWGEQGLVSADCRVNAGQTATTYREKLHFWWAEPVAYVTAYVTAGGRSLSVGTALSEWSLNQAEHYEPTAIPPQFLFIVIREYCKNNRMMKTLVKISVRSIVPKRILAIAEKHYPARLKPIV